MSVLPKGFNLPAGMNMKQAMKAMSATSECVKVVELLIKEKSPLGDEVRKYIAAYPEEYPILAGALTDRGGA